MWGREPVSTSITVSTNAVDFKAFFANGKTAATIMAMMADFMPCTNGHQHNTRNGSLTNPLYFKLAFSNICSVIIKAVVQKVSCKGAFNFCCCNGCNIHHVP